MPVPLTSVQMGTRVTTMAVQARRTLAMLGVTVEAVDRGVAVTVEVGGAKNSRRSM